jgi:hypothetical protein
MTGPLERVVTIRHEGLAILEENISITVSL